MRKFQLICFVTFMAIVHGAPAVEPVPTGLKDAFRYAFANRLDIQIVNNSKERASWGITEARGLFYPTLGVVGSTQYNTIYGGNEIRARFTDATGQQFDVTIDQLVPRYQSQLAFDLTFNLYAGGASAARLDRANAYYENISAQERMLRGLVILEVANAHATLQKSYLLVKRLKRGLVIVKEDGRGDPETKALELAEAELRLASAQATLAEHWQAYLAALGMPSLETPMPEHLSFANGTGNIDLNALLPESPSAASVDSARAELDAARASAEENYAEFFPQLDLFARYGYGSRQEDVLRDASYVYKNERVVGLRMSWNWFNGFQSQARYRQSKYDAEGKRLQWEQRQRDWSNAVQDRERRVAMLETRLRLAQQHLAVAERKGRIVKRLLESKQISTVQYKTGLLLVTEAEDNVAGVQADLDVARLALKVEKIAGTSGAMKTPPTGSL